MSIRVLEWAFSLEGPRLSDRLVLLVLADYADAGGRSWPTVKRIASRAGLTQGAARTALHRLRDSGLLSIEERRVDGTRNKSNVYVLSIESDAKVYGEHEEPPGAENDTPLPPFAGEALPMPGREAVPMPAMEAVPMPEQEGNRTVTRTTNGTVKNEPLVLTIVGDTFDRFWAVYPRRAGKAAAKAAWDRATKRALPETIISAATKYRDDPNREDKFTPHPTTWLNQDRWEDDPLPSRNTVDRRPVSRVEQNLAEYDRLYGRQNEQQGSLRALDSGVGKGWSDSYGTVGRSLG